MVLAVLVKENGRAVRGACRRDDPVSVRVCGVWHKVGCLSDA